MKIIGTKYGIKLATSSDGKNWLQEGLTSIKLKKMRELLLDRQYYMKIKYIKCGFVMKKSWKIQNWLC